MEWTGERYVPAMAGEIACEHLNRYHFVLNQFDTTDKIVLDIASGEGYGSFLLARFAKQVYGVDISHEAIEHAKVNYEKDNLLFLQGEATGIPLAENSVDVIVSFETIEHLGEHQEMLDEVKRVLKVDGVLIISSPDKLHYTDMPGAENHFHVKELYGDEFQALIKKNFKTNLFFDQKIFVGSVITLSEGNVPYNKPLIVNKHGKSLFEPTYNIAVSTDKEELVLNHTSINYTENFRMIIPEDLLHANYEGQVTVSNSLSYKLGSLVVKPVLKMKKVVSFLNNFLFSTF